MSDLEDKDPRFGQGRSPERISNSWKVFFMAAYILVGSLAAFFIDRFVRELLK